MGNEKELIKVKNILEELYNKEELDRIKENLLTLPQVVRVLKKSRGSVYYLIARKRIQPVRFMNRYYFPKEQIMNLIYPIDEQKKNQDYELSKGMKKYLGISEDEKLLKKREVKNNNTCSDKQILTDDKKEAKNKTNPRVIRIRMNM
jgi:hypothetical protein